MIDSIDSSAHTVLVVDDEPAIRNIVGTVLTSLGMTVLKAANGNTALDAVNSRETPPTFVVADVVMPQLGGIGLLTELRQKNPDLPALLISGFCEDHEALREAIDHRTHFLQKPFNLKTLTKTIANLLHETQGNRPSQSAPGGTDTERSDRIPPP